MTTRSHSRDTNVSHGPRKRPSKSLRPKKEEESADDSAWIHRDKLAAIEIQEMEEAGMHVRQPHRSDSVGQGRTTRSSSRSMSRSGIRKAQSKDMLDAEEVYVNGQEEFERKRVSTIHAAEEEPDEVPAEYRQHTARPSTSRIPISKASPAPVSTDVLERETPSRAGNNVPSTWEDLKRMRSGSTGSGVLLEDRPGSAKKAATHAKRPSTSHTRPEGEAPWIATMYKPDPRLPPDQQIIPTHAKRMMQEQWQPEKTSPPDNDFRLLDETPKPPPKVEEEVSALPPIENATPEWPLVPRSESPRSAGYRITPSVNPSPQRSPVPTPSPVELPATEKPPVRVPDYEEKDEKAMKRGCCCVMM